MKVGSLLTFFTKMKYEIELMCTLGARLYPRNPGCLLESSGVSIAVQRATPSLRRPA